MKIALFLLLNLFPFLYLEAQSIVQMDTLERDGKVQVTLDISSNFTSVSIVDIQLFHVIDSDSILVFEGIYDFSIQDPSDFSQFEFNTESNHMNLSLGWFDLYNSFAIIRILNEGLAAEEFTLN